MELHLRVGRGSVSLVRRTTSVRSGTGLSSGRHRRQRASSRIRARPTDSPRTSFTLGREYGLRVYGQLMYIYWWPPMPRRVVVLSKESGTDGG